MVRAFIIAALAWAALVGANPVPDGNAQNGQAGRNQTASEQRAPAPAAAPKEDATPSQDAGCEPGQDDRESDLCAQWKAADAAYDASLSARAQTLIGYIGLALGAITMIAAIAAALYARRAALATEETVGIARDASQGAEAALAIAERNAKAAADQVAVSEATARRQLRAYMGTPGAAVIDPAGAAPHVVIDTKNFGQTPAYDLRNSYIINLYRREPNGGTKRIVYNVPTDSVSICEPGHVQNVGAVLDHPIDGQTIGMEAELTQTFVDVFGARRWRRMTYQLTLHSYHLVGKIALNSAPQGNAEGEGEPPPTALVTGPDDPRA